MAFPELMESFIKGNLVKMLTTIRISGQHSAMKNKSKNNEGFFKASYNILQTCSSEIIPDRQPALTAPDYNNIVFLHFNASRFLYS